MINDRRWVERGIYSHASEEWSRGADGITDKLDKYNDQIGAIQGMVGVMEGRIREIKDRKEAGWGRDQSRHEDLEAAIAEHERRASNLREQVDVFQKQVVLTENTLEDMMTIKRISTSITEQTGVSYADGPYVARFDNFLSPEECETLLSLIRQSPKMQEDPSGNGKREAKEAEAVPTSASAAAPVQIGEDGFALPTTDVTMDEMGIDVEISRVSSRTFFNPPPRKRRGADDGDGKIRRIHPVVERLLSKIETATGIPALDHVELPVQYERFTVNQFQEPRSPFSDSIAMSSQSWAATSPLVGGEGGGAASSTGGKLQRRVTLPDPDAGGRGEGGILELDPEMERYAREELIRLGAGLLEEEEDMYGPRTMHNGRVFGFTVFLSDVEKGGDIVFTGMGDYAVKPLMGRAVLFPTSLSLLGERPKKGEREENDNEEPLDEDFPGGDGTFILEDMTTTFKHLPVEAGIKYVLNVYLRRYPDR